MLGEHNPEGGLEQNRKVLQRGLRHAALQLLATRPGGYTIAVADVGLAVATNGRDPQSIPDAKSASTEDEERLVFAAQSLRRFENIAAASMPLTRDFKLYVGRRDAIEGLIQPRTWIPYLETD